MDDVRKQVVRISFRWLPDVEDKEVMIIAGIIASINDDGFAKIIANPLFFKMLERCAVRFPNEQGYEEESEVLCSSVKFPGRYLCSFDVKPKESGYIKAANFSMGDPRRCKSVDAFFFPRKEYLTPESFVEGKVIDSTTVKDKAVGIFFHDCPMHEYGYLGSPVFNKKGNLVGISYQDQGHVQAWSVWKLRNVFFRELEGKERISYVED